MSMKAFEFGFITICDCLRFKILSPEYSVTFFNIFNCSNNLLHTLLPHPENLFSIYAIFLVMRVISVGIFNERNVSIK